MTVRSETLHVETAVEELSLPLLFLLVIARVMIAASWTFVAALYIVFGVPLWAVIQVINFISKFVSVDAR